MKKSFYLLFSCLILSSCSSKYEVEDKLYAYIDSEFSKQSLSLSDALDSLEFLYLEEDLIQSPSPADYQQYFQTNIDEGQLLSLQSEYFANISNRVPSTYTDFERCALQKFDRETFDKSKFGQLSNKIISDTELTGQITSETVAKAYLEILSEEDFEHPFYRANVLLSYNTTHLLSNVLVT